MTNATKPISGADAKALVRAIELSLVPKVQELCAKGSVAVDIPQKWGGATTPLLQAVPRSHVEIIGLVLAAGGAVGSQDDYGRTPLHLARTAEVATLLLDAGADLGARDKRQQTPLHTATITDNIELVKLFVARGADLEAKDVDGQTPYVATTKFAVRALLKELGAKGLENTDGKVLTPKRTSPDPQDVSVRDGAVGVDANGHLWFYSNRGIFCWDGHALSLFQFNESFAVGNILPGAGGRLYFATNWGLVVKSGEEWRLYSTKDSHLHDQHITEMAVDREGRAAVMGYGGEEKLDRPISVFDGKDFTLWTAGAEIKAGFETNCLAFDARNRLVLGTETGVVFADGTRWEVPDELGLLAGVNHLASDGDAVWAAAHREIHRVTPAGESARSVELPNGPKCVLVDGATLWIGMSYGGLLRVRDGEAKHLFGDNNVEGMALGKDGTLWLSSGSALFGCRGEEITPFDASGGKPKPRAAAEPAPKAKPKKRKLAAVPKTPLVGPKKVAAHVVKAITSAKLENLSAKLLMQLVRPAIGIVVTKKAAEVKVGGSKLGGRPDVAAGTKWPTYRDDRDRFLPCLFQINLADVAKHDVEKLLPKKGRIVFFADTQPDELTDFRVVFDDGTKKPTRLDWPEDLVDRKKEEDFVAQFPEHALEFYPTWTLPSAEYLEKYAELTDVDRKALSRLEDEIHALDPKKSSTTRLLGWPNTLQGEIVTNPETIVLLQIDGDMDGPAKLKELLRYWGNGIAHYLLARKHLEAHKLEKATADLAYT